MDVIEFVKELLSKFDLAYMFAVNVATYIIIKVIDNLNGEKIVPTYLKRIIAFIVGAVIAFAVISFGADKTIILYSFILSLVSWDCMWKPILNIIGDKFNYKKIKIMAKKSTSTKSSGSKGSIPPTTGTTVPLRPIKKDKK